MPDDTNQSYKEGLIENAAEAAKEVVRGSSPLSKGMALVLGIVGLLIASNSDTIIKLFQITHDVQHLQAAHDKCHDEMAVLKSEVLQLRQEVKDLKTKLNIAQN